MESHKPSSDEIPSPEAGKPLQPNGSESGPGDTPLLRSDCRDEMTVPRRLILLAGCGIGVLSFAVAMLTIPASVSSPSQHDLILAKNLALIFPAMVGFWGGFVRRSLRWIMIGVSVGPVIGTLYNALSGGSFNFFTVVIGLPCLLSGVAALAIGRGQRSWADGALARFLKGLFAGVILGVVYDFVLNVLCFVLIELFAEPGELNHPSIERFHFMMWCAGIVAMGVAGGVYLLLFHWCANLNRRKWPERRARWRMPFAITRRRAIIAGITVVCLVVVGHFLGKHALVAFHWRAMMSARAGLQSGRPMSWWERCYGIVFVPNQDEWQLLAHFGHHESRLVKLGCLERRKWVLKNIMYRSEEEEHLIRTMQRTFPDCIDWSVSAASAATMSGPIEVEVVDLSEQIPKWEGFLAERDRPDYRERFMPAPEKTGNNATKIKHPEGDGAKSGNRNR